MKKKKPLNTYVSASFSSFFFTVVDYYKKAISSFMPQRDKAWDNATNQGNPTVSCVPLFEVV